MAKHSFTISDCHAAGLTLKEAAVVMRCDYSTAARRARRSGVKLAKSPDKEARLALLMGRIAPDEVLAARVRWDEIDARAFSKKNVLTRVQPFIGSGLNLRQVADKLGCSPPAVSKALKKLGAKL